MTARPRTIRKDVRGPRTDAGENMIYSDGTNDKIYAEHDGAIAVCLKKAEELDSDTPDGRYDIADGIYVNVMTYSPKKPDEATAETHRDWADLQYLLSGCEYMGVPDVAKAEQISPYDAQRDIALWRAPVALLPLRERNWALFYPGEPHAPSLYNGCDKVKKAVFKIRIAKNRP